MAEGRLARLIREEYQSREHALVKHSILEAYLERLFMIVGQTFDVIQYVDCYSGPWQTAGSDDSSIGIAIKTMERCRIDLSRLRKSTRPAVLMRALFVEKDKNAFSQLEKIIEEKKCDVSIDLHAWNKDFVESIPEVLEWSGNSFTFYFIDPLGYKSIGPQTLGPLLERKNTELMINFMYDFINRFYDESDSEVLDFMRAIKGDLFGDDVAFNESDSREDRITGLYRKRLKEASLTPTWTARMRILDPRKERTKYSLIYLTHNPKGMSVFCEETERGARIQYVIRSLNKANKREERSGIIDLFADDMESQLPAHEGDSYRIPALAQIVLKYIDGEVCCDEDMKATILEETDCSVTTLQGTIKWLMDNGALVNLSAKRARPKNPIHFEKNETVKRL